MKRRHRRYRHRRSNGGTPGFQIAPFIDVVFVIVLFFLVKVAVRPREFQLTARLPGGQAPPMPVIEEQVAVDGDGQLTHNDDEVSAQELTARLARVREQCARTHSPLLVTVATAPGTSYSRLIDALGALNNAGVYEATFADAEE